LKENNEIKALLNLIDDPDEEVFQSVCNKLVSFGKEIIPNLEQVWEKDTNESTQERIETLIHQLHFQDLSKELDRWKNEEHNSLLSGAIIVAKYHYPDIQTNIILQQIEKLRRNIWLELNVHLTPMERINVFNSILYHYSQHTGLPLNYNTPEAFFINKTLDSKSGNSISNGILYLILCQLLDIPVFAVRIPNQYVLAYIDHLNVNIHEYPNNMGSISFFIDPLTGQMFSGLDVQHYLQKNNIAVDDDFLKPMTNPDIISHLLKELSKCFNSQQNLYKMYELLELSKNMKS
jgi:regulator of sirC expression with transglutaminase-like and TPR domain